MLGMNDLQEQVVMYESDEERELIMYIDDKLDHVNFSSKSNILIESGSRESEIIELIQLV